LTDELSNADVSARTFSTSTFNSPAPSSTSTNTEIQDNNTSTNNIVPFNVKCLLINICGLKSKLKAIDFEEYISSYDIVCLTETKLDEIDAIEVPGFVLHSKVRTKRKRASGGVAILVKSSLSQSIERVEIENNEC
jgi:hypothetical protein